MPYHGGAARESRACQGRRGSRVVTKPLHARRPLVTRGGSFLRDQLDCCTHTTTPKEGKHPMAFSIRRALGVAVVAAAAGVGPLAAQGSQPPQVTVGGVVYTQYVYQLKDTLNHVNSFDITRAYVNVLGKFSGGVTTRVTGDIYRNPTDTSLSYRLKYAFATYTPTASPLTFKAGLIHTPWLDWEEALWDYRMQGTMAMDRASHMSASDYGVGVDGKWMADKVNFQ